jgi:Protein of unknown function (DUF3618)
MTHQQHDERMTMPGQPPTDEDLRHDAELTRKELAQTVSALGEKADVKSRMRATAQQRAAALQAKGTELMGKLPDPVTSKLLQMWRLLTLRPAALLAGMGAFLSLLMFWRRIRRH